MKPGVWILTAVLAFGAGQVRAQVSEDDYPRYFDFIVSNDWVCATAQPFDGVDDGELNMEQDFHFDKSYSDGYRFAGHGSETMSVDGTDYTGTFSLEGFGFNDDSFGIGISIKSATMTGGDTLPSGWNWNDGADIQLHLVEDNADTNTWHLEGYQNSGGVTITYNCGGRGET